MAKQSPVLHRRREAVRARVLGVSYADLAERFGTTDSVVRSWIEKQLAEHPAEDVQKLRAVEAIGLDKLENESWLRLNRCPDDDAFVKLAGSILKIKERRARLLGLDRPVVVEHKVDLRRDYDEDIELLVAELAGGGVLQSTPADLYIDGTVVR